MQDAYLDHCRKQIEHKLGWGPSGDWTTQDFEELSVRMQDATGQVISSTTLKRIWGRVAYDSKPSRHSLDTLAAFLGYDSWRSFNSAVKQETPQVDEEITASGRPVHSEATKSNVPVLALSVFMLLLGAATVVWLGLRDSNDTALPPDDSTVRFVSRPLAYDLPNTVVFEYDVAGVPADSFFIQQSWDDRLRTRISAENSAHSSTYFYPGYYSAKLIANDMVLKEHPVHVKTASWTALLEESPTPVYLPEDAMLDDGTLSVSREWLDGNGFPIDSGNHVLGYYYVQDFGPLMMDNFSLEASVSHQKPEIRRPCQGGQVTIRGEDGMIRFPFDIAGCTGLMRVIAGDVHHTGEEHDLSALGADYASWQLVKLDVKDKTVRIQIGTNPPYTFAYTYDMGKVVGMWFQFVGRGALDQVRLHDENGRMMYEEVF